MLGPLEVRTDDDSGIVLDVGGSRLRALLIMLALRPGQLVPASQLIDGLWVSATALVMRGHVGLNFGRQHVAAEEDFLAATGIFSGLGER
jgi:hypothetical protein